MEAHTKLVTFLIVAAFISFVYESAVSQVVLNGNGGGLSFLIAVQLVLPITLLSAIATKFGLWAKGVRWAIPATLFIASFWVLLATALNMPCIYGCY